MKELVFRDRGHAGQLLAEALMTYAGRDDVIVLALPRGGVPVAFEVASRLHAPLDVIVVRKLGVLVGVLATEPPESLSVKVSGELASEDVGVLKLSALRGLFSTMTC